MNVISVPIRLRIAAAALFLCVPLVAFEIVVVTRAPWWKLPLHTMSYWAIIFVLICFPLSSWLVAAKRWAFSLATGLSVAWVVASAGIAIRMRYPTLGFYTFFLIIFLGAELFWLKLELEKSYIDPQIKWFQGLPKPIPGLKCQLISGEKLVDLNVSRIDEDGVFLFSSKKLNHSAAIFLSLLEKKKLELIFTFKNFSLNCSGVPTSTACEGAGAGIRFFALTIDKKKEIGDFLEILRGEGYA